MIYKKSVTKRFLSNGLAKFQRSSIWTETVDVYGVNTVFRISGNCWFMCILDCVALGAKTFLAPGVVNE